MYFSNGGITCEERGQRNYWIVAAIKIQFRKSVVAFKPDPPTKNAENYIRVPVYISITNRCTIKLVHRFSISYIVCLYHTSANRNLFRARDRLDKWQKNRSLMNKKKTYVYPRVFYIWVVLIRYFSEKTVGDGVSCLDFTFIARGHVVCT